MAKTKRRKQNRSPAQPFRNATAHVLEAGLHIQVAGHRAAEGAKQIASVKAKPVFIGRSYTGVPRGKQYPYAGKKRGGATPEPEASPGVLSRVVRATKSIMVNGE